MHTSVFVVKRRVYQYTYEHRPRFWGSICTDKKIYTLTPEDALSSMGRNGSKKYIFNELSGYKFTRPTDSCTYVKVIKYLMNNGDCSKAEILKNCLHLVPARSEMSSLWAGMYNAYLIEYTKDHKVRLGANAIPLLEKEGLV